MNAATQANKTWSDRFMPQIKGIVAQYLPLIDTASTIDDLEHNTDLIVTKQKFRIACRVRRFDYWDRYRGEFTIRCRSQFGLKTEWHKLFDGAGDFMFYGFADRSSQYVFDWHLIDLSVLRVAYSAGEIKECDVRSNRDGSALAAFRLIDLPAGGVMAGND